MGIEIPTLTHSLYFSSYIEKARLAPKGNLPPLAIASIGAPWDQSHDTSQKAHYFAYHLSSKPKYYLSHLSMSSSGKQ